MFPLLTYLYLFHILKSFLLTPSKGQECSLLFSFLPWGNLPQVDTQPMMVAKQLVFPWTEKTFLQSSLDLTTQQWFVKKTAACFFPWLKRQEIEQQWPNSGNSTRSTGTMVILLNLLSGTSPNLSSSHFKNLQMHPPRIYALAFICKEVATEMKNCINKVHNCAVCLMADLFRFTFILSSGIPGPDHVHTCSGYLSRFIVQSILWDPCANWHLSIKTITLLSIA